MNYAEYRGRNNVNINGGYGDPSFSEAFGRTSVSADGCLYWYNEEDRSKEVHSYWKIQASRSNDSLSCELVEAMQMGRSVMISSAQDCELISIDPNLKVATISFRDIVITINAQQTIWASATSDTKKGGELVGCRDRRKNWYLFN
jgi:hypothetical protein